MLTTIKTEILYFDLNFDFVDIYFFHRKMYVCGRPFILQTLNRAKILKISSEKIHENVRVDQ